MTIELTIPCLPCVSLESIFPFYEMLGFQITYRQKAPNVYGVVQRGGVALHFFGMKGLVPKDAFSTCLVIVPEVERLHATFADAMRQTLGKLPVTGIPRMTRMRPGQGRFTVTDPAGNSIIFIKNTQSDATGKTDETEAEFDTRKLTPLARAIHTATQLRDSKGDDAAAAKVLDGALARNPAAPPLDRARALAARTELAVAMGDAALAQSLRVELNAVPLTDDERERWRDELGAADALERLMQD